MDSQSIVLLANCGEKIDKKSVEARRKLLNRYCSLMDAETAFENNDFSTVVDVLNFDGGDDDEITANIVDFSENRAEKLRRLFLLYESARNLHLADLVLKTSVDFVNANLTCCQKMTSDQILPLLDDFRTGIDMLVREIVGKYYN